MKKSPTTKPKAKQIPKEDLMSGETRRKVIVGLFIAIVGGVVVNKLSCQNNPDIINNTTASNASITQGSHSSATQNIYNGNVTINKVAASKTLPKEVVKTTIALRVRVNYSELNSLISKNLNPILENNTKDTIMVTFAYPAGAFREHANSSEYLPGNLTMYGRWGEMQLEKCTLPWVPEFREDVVKNQARRNIDSLVNCNIGFICKMLKRCLNQ